MPLPSVLVVEDDPAIRRMLEAALVREPLRVDCAADGVEALEKLAATPYAVMLLDLMLPRLSGLEVLAQLATRTPRPMVFVITAFDESVLLQLDTRLVHGILRKPFDLERLVELVRECALHWQAAISPNLGLRGPDPQLTC
jgi:DNA-binding response OmpR family regulator